jgi:hypothetical protein
MAALARECGALAYSLAKAEVAACEAESCLAGLPGGTCLGALVELARWVISSGAAALACGS